MTFYAGGRNDDTHPGTGHVTPDRGGYRFRPVGGTDRRRAPRHVEARLSRRVVEGSAASRRPNRHRSERPEPASTHLGGLVLIIDGGGKLWCRAVATWTRRCVSSRRSAARPYPWCSYQPDGNSVVASGAINTDGKFLWVVPRPAAARSVARELFDPDALRRGRRIADGEPDARAASSSSAPPGSRCGRADPTASAFAVFLLASLALLVVPGPAVPTSSRAASTRVAGGNRFGARHRGR